MHNTKLDVFAMFLSYTDKTHTHREKETNQLQKMRLSESGDLKTYKSIKISISKI